MLVISRNITEKIIVNGDISLCVLGIVGKQVKIGISAPEEIPIIREEISHNAKKKATSKTIQYPRMTPVF